MERQRPPEYVKTLPVAYFGEQDDLCLELLSSVYGETDIVPVPVEFESAVSDEEDYLSRKYKELVQPLFLAVAGEIIFPLIGMFDTEMFILNYSRFYS